MLKWIKIALVILIAVTGVNDIGKWLVGAYTVEDRTRTMSFQAAQVAKKTRTADSGWPTVAQAAQQSGLRVLAYGQTAASVTVTAQIAVSGTWVIGPTIALIGGKPLSTPFTIEQTVTTPIG
ncbi:MAG: hypothetical protein Q7W16_07680 [Coriobacteriia bacterium]|nr:hypothetical protein [Coriobacteriia bacterium]